MSKELSKVGKKYSKRCLFISRTFNSKLFLKLTASIIQPSIICIQTLRYEPENRKLHEIELAIPWLKTFPDLMKFINLKETPESSHTLLIELAWFLFYKYYKKNLILKKASEKQEFFFISLAGKILKLNIVYERQSLTLEDYLIYLFKLKIMHEKEILKKCRMLNSFYVDIDGENLYKFFKKNPQFNYEKLKEKARNEIINLGFKFEDLQENSNLISSVDNYLKIFKISRNLKEFSNGIKATPRFYIGRYEKAGYITKGMAIGSLNEQFSNDNSTYICTNNCDIVYLDKEESKSKLTKLYNLIFDKKKKILSKIKNHYYIFSRISNNAFYEELLPHFEFKLYHQGDKIFMQNSIYEGIYLLQHGQINIYLTSSVNKIGNYILNVKNTLKGFKNYILENKKNNKTKEDEEPITPKIMNDTINLSLEKSAALNEVKKFDILTIPQYSIFGTNELYDYKTELYFFSAECQSKEAIIYFLPKNILNSLLAKEKPIYIALADIVQFKVNDIIGKLKYHIKFFESVMNKKSKSRQKVKENNNTLNNTLNNFLNNSLANSLTNSIDKKDIKFNVLMNTFNIIRRNKINETIASNKRIGNSCDFPNIYDEKSKTIKKNKERKYYLTEKYINSFPLKNDQYNKPIKSFNDKVIFNKLKKVKLFPTPINLYNNKKGQSLGTLFLSSGKKNNYIQRNNINLNLPKSFPFSVPNSYFNSTSLSKEKESDFKNSIVIK